MQTVRSQKVWPDDAVWFSGLSSRKSLEVVDDLFSCRIGFNRKITNDSGTRFVDDVVEVEAPTVDQAIHFARAEYEFLTMDTEM